MDSILSANYLNDEVMNPQRQVKAKELARIHRRVMVFVLALGFGYILVWLYFGWSTSLKDALLSITTNDWLSVIGFAAVFGGIWVVWDNHHAHGERLLTLAGATG
jgi:hypothetical protein